MDSLKRITNITGWAVFAIAAAVMIASAESSGSLWDCGEFVSGCFKLQVVHPPGAPLFLLIGRLFILVGELVSKNPSAIAVSVNILSGLSTALAAMFICWTTMMFGKLALLGRNVAPNQNETIALAGAGAVAGFCTAFATSIWFSAVEGEVYAMSTFFTCLTLWAATKWFYLPDKPETDKWMILAIYSMGLSIGVHLLSLLAFPALAMLYYIKKSPAPKFLTLMLYALGGVILVYAFQALIVTGIPNMWSKLEYGIVNYLGVPVFNLSAIPLILLLAGIIYAGIRYSADKKISMVAYVVSGVIIGYLTNNVLGIFLGGAAGYGLSWINARSAPMVQNFFVALALCIIGYSTFGMVVIRANANPPINMNNPKDPFKLTPYLNREQYGERPLLFGPQFTGRPVNISTEDRYGRVDNHYEVVDRKTEYEYNPEDKVFFPRMSHSEGDRETYYKQWMGLDPQQPTPGDRPNSVDNFSYFLQYQVGWMYWRYFMWNFSGRQNFDQGYGPWNRKDGNWISGIPFIDNARLYPTKMEPARMKNDPSRNKYYMLPFIFGLFGLLWQYQKRRNDFWALLALFLITGIGIVVFTNEPPNEPRDRDYAIIGSIFTYAIWIGLGVLAIFDFLRQRDVLVPVASVDGVATTDGPVLQRRGYMGENIAALLSALLVLVAPLLMGTSNFADSSRHNHFAARDYASNFLNSCDKNAIIFTYGDNDTYPLWYAQEVESIRRDVRVVNLSLIAVDWYIDALRRKINESPRVNLSVPSSALLGMKRNQLPVLDGPEMSLKDALKYAGEDHPVQAGGGNTYESAIPTHKLYIPINRQKVIANGVVQPTDSIVDRISFTLPGNSIIKDDLAVLDIIANNIEDRPVYFAVTCRTEKLEGMGAYTQLEGLALRVVPVKSKGDDSRSYGMIGEGSVATDKVFHNIMDKFRWGNLDKIKTFVDKSYTPSVQTTQFVILRTSQELVKQQKNTEAIQLLDRMFEAFPDMNFPYNSQTLYFLQVYADAGPEGYAHAKKHMDILAQHTLENLNFYKTLNADQLATFQQDQQMDLRSKDMLIQIAEHAGDTAKKAELEKMFADFKSPNVIPGMRN